MTLLSLRRLLLLQLGLLSSLVHSAINNVNVKLTRDLYGLSGGYRLTTNIFPNEKTLVPGTTVLLNLTATVCLSVSSILKI